MPLQIKTILYSMRKVNCLYYITLISYIFLSSCVKTEDDKENVPTPQDPNNSEVTLTNEYLAGTWELFYNNKLYKNNESETLGTAYRYPDSEGRKITYDKSGNFIEYNAWDSILTQGKYRIILKTKESEMDQVAYTFPPKDPKNGDDTTTYIKFPVATKEYYDRYHDYGYKNDSLKQVFFLADTWFFRREGSDYELPSPYNKINNLTKASILGTWKFIDYSYISYNSPQIIPDKEALKGRETYTFKENNTFTISIDNDSAEGEYFIIDDIIQTRRPKFTTSGKQIGWFTQIFWIKNPIQTTSTGTYFVQYFRARDAKDLTNVITQEYTYQKVEQ